MKIYTKTGDKGETGIIGKRVSKASKLMDALGNLDELNASIGIVVVEAKNSIPESEYQSNFKDIVQDLEHIQSIIFSTGAILAAGRIEVDFKKETKDLEKKIDQMDAKVEPLKNFILPGGSKISANLHLARVICRRAERSLVDLFSEDFDIQLANSTASKDSDSERSKTVLPFINRLSDYLFVLARYVNMLEGQKETVWNKKTS